MRYAAPEVSQRRPRYHSNRGLFRTRLLRHYLSLFRVPFLPLTPGAPTPLPPSCLGTADILKSPLIIFVMGSPGCGKETQCKNMATKYGFCHVGLGQLLWQETQQGTRRGQKIHDVMLQGLLVPTVRGCHILDMISDRMLSCLDSRAFLIDGFPRELRQAREFEHIASDPKACEGYKVGQAPNLVIVFDCSMETVVQRALHRGQVECRASDCKSAIRQHLEMHYTLCEPTLAFYQQKNLL
ncbi:PREDICTED: adenylate kinase isoenzyme 1-like [Lipotes vexillifer]|uniref:Adenylate kinase isoenzyme 1-like n=1 Tax=Lipotes vexillifer TaxID=118797 RepID=A0A340XHC7_LIPVE|nr:PREDICTED: adenylate kinase isoenzyme 1-like [Lipotes vexillifer]